MDDLNEDEEELDKKTEEAEAKKKTSEPATKTSAKERRYCKPEETKTWFERKKIIIDHGDGTEPKVVAIDPTQAAKKEADAHPRKTVASVSAEAVEAERERAKHETFDTPEQRDETAVKRAAYKMLRRGSVAAATEAATRALIKPFSDDGLTPAQREEKHGKKLERDAWCRQEKYYKDSKSQQEWLEGSKVVTKPQNRAGDENVTVRELTDEEKAARAAKHLAALKALGLGLESVEGVLQKISSKSPKPQQESPRRDYFGPNAQSPPSPGKGKGKAQFAESPDALDEHVPTPSPRLEGSTTPVPTKSPNPGLALTRTERIDTDDEDEESDTDRSPSRPARKPSPPAAKRGNSMSVMRQLFKRQGSVSADSDPRGRNFHPAGSSRGSSPERSIRFAAADRPARELLPGAGSRPLPVVGGSMSARKTTGASK